MHEQDFYVFNLWTYFLIAFGGALGSVARFGSPASSPTPRPDLPMGHFAVNVTDPSLSAFRCPDRPDGRWLVGAPAAVFHDRRLRGHDVFPHLACKRGPHARGD